MNTSAPDLNNKKTRARKDGTFLRVKDLSELFRRTFVEASAFGECPQAGRPTRQIYGQSTERPSVPMLCHLGRTNGSLYAGARGFVLDR